MTKWMVAVAGIAAMVPAAALADGYAFKELARGEDRAALLAIEASAGAATDDPALLINHGVALARVGEYDAARTKFEAALRGPRVRLETAGGEWIDSRTLARRGLSLIEEGAFEQYVAMASR